MISESQNKQISSKVFGQPGFTTDICLSIQEISVFRHAIAEQWLSVIQNSYPALAEKFNSVGIDRYHELDHLIDHERLWGKKVRVLGESAVNKLKTLPFMDKLREEFGDFTISDVVYGSTVERGREEIYWRLVRPNKASDVGPIHADKWFHEGVEASSVALFPVGATTVKIWLPIFCEPGLNGLIVVPGSHLRDWRYRLVNKGGVIKPMIEENADSLGGFLVPTPPGTLLIFNERLLHGGAVNNGVTTRVSVEITMVFP